jgi:hypothetical protein
MRRMDRTAIFDFAFIELVCQTAILKANEAIAVVGKG